MRGWVVPVFAALLCYSAAASLQRIKRADETVMFGNQQNLAHKSVKKSGPVPPNSKLAVKQAEVAAGPADDPESELAGVAKPPEDDVAAEKDLHTLVSTGPAEANAPVFTEERKKKASARDDGEKPKKKADPAEKAEEKAVEKAEKAKENAQKEYEYDLQNRYLYLLDKLEPEAFAAVTAPGSPDSPQEGRWRQKRSTKAAMNRLSPAKLQRLRRSLSRLSSESHMAVNAQHRRKRDANVDPRTLALLEYMLSQRDDGYDVPEEVEEPVYTDEEEEEPQRVRRDLLDDYSNYAFNKRADTELMVPEEPVEEPEEEEEPVSVFESQYGPVSYGLIEHEGVRGLFVPVEQPSMQRLIEAEKEDRDEERARLRTLATLLNLNEEEKK